LPLNFPETDDGKDPIKVREAVGGVILFLFPGIMRAATEAEPYGVWVTTYRDDVVKKVRDYSSDASMLQPQLRKVNQPEWGTVIVSPNSQ